MVSIRSFMLNCKDITGCYCNKKSYPKKDQTTKTNRSWDKRMLGNEQLLKINQDLINKCPAYFYARYLSAIFPNC